MVRTSIDDEEVLLLFLVNMTDAGQEEPGDGVLKIITLSELYERAAEVSLPRRR